MTVPIVNKIVHVHDAPENCVKIVAAIVTRPENWNVDADNFMAALTKGEPGVISLAVENIVLIALEVSQLMDLGVD